jgi:hypothetical protein
MLDQDSEEPGELTLGVFLVLGLAWGSGQGIEEHLGLEESDGAKRLSIVLA